MRDARQIYGSKDADSSSRSFLLVSPEFPPSVSAGALRWQEMSRFFAQADWQIDVLTVDPADPDHADWTRLDRLPKAMRVFALPLRAALVERALMKLWRRQRRSSASERAGDAARTDRARLEAQTPSRLRAAARLWIEDASERENVAAFARAGQRLVEGANYAFVISCGPPHWAHEAALRIARAKKLPLVIDLRDPWAIIEPKTAERVDPAWLDLARHREREVFHAASLVVMNTEAAAAAMRDRYLERHSERDKIVAIRNGFDLGAMRTAVDSGAAKDARFLVVYAGTIYLDRQPRGLFQAAAALVAAETLSPDTFGLLFVGSNDPAALRAEAAEFGLADYLDVRPTCPRAELLEILASASVLVSLAQGHDLAIPSKVYEYMHFEAWLLAIATPQSATSLLLKQSQAVVVDPAQPAELAGSLRRLFEQFKNGQRPPNLASNPEFGREAQTQRLIEALAAIGLA